MRPVLARDAGFIDEGRAAVGGKGSDDVARGIVAQLSPNIPHQNRVHGLEITFQIPPDQLSVLVHSLPLDQERFPEGCAGAQGDENRAEKDGKISTHAQL